MQLFLIIRTNQAFKKKQTDLKFSPVVVLNRVGGTVAHTNTSIPAALVNDLNLSHLLMKGITKVKIRSIPCLEIQFFCSILFSIFCHLPYFLQHFIFNIMPSYILT
jgi:hypothetical protein